MDRNNLMRGIFKYFRLMSLGHPMVPQRLSENEVCAPKAITNFRVTPHSLSSVSLVYVRVS